VGTDGAGSDGAGSDGAATVGGSSATERGIENAARLIMQKMIQTRMCARLERMTYVRGL
jgi:hypothetical protein